jgi:hypothetical protein
MSWVLFAENVTAPANAAPVSVGFVPNTKDPLPVSLVMDEARLALVGVARNVSMPVAAVTVAMDVTPEADRISA